MNLKDSILPTSTKQIDARSTTTYDREQLNATVVEKWEKGWQREATFLASL